MIESSSLLSRLNRLRRMIRRRLVFYGFCAVVAGGIFSFLTIAFLDWLLWLPPLLRMIIAVFFFAGFVVASMHWIVKPLRTRITLDEVAGKLEQHFSSLHDRLSSAVNFIQRGDPGSKKLMRQVITNTEQAVENLPLESALSIKPMVVQSGWFFASLMILFVITIASPGWARTGFYRYLHPLGSIEWPRSVSIVPVTGDLVAAMGDSVTVRMEVERGWNKTLRGVVRMREPSGVMHTMALHDDGNGMLYTTIDAVTRDMTYWFEAGDDDTMAYPCKIRVVRRPELVEALVEVEPPPYAKDHAVGVHDLRDESIAAPIGGFIKIMFRTSKPMRRDAQAEYISGLRTDDGDMIPMSMVGDDPYALSVRLEVVGDLRFRAELWDQDGFENRGSTQFSIRAIPDQAPLVSILKPLAVIELTPNGSVDIVTRVIDDFGIDELDLKVIHRSGDEVFTTSLIDQMDLVNEEHGIEARANYTLNIEPLLLTPGEVLVYTISATDNHETSTAQAQIGRSSDMRIKIISQAEFDARIRSDLAMLETRIRQATLDQADILDRTQTLMQRESDANTLVVEQETAANLSAEESRLIRRIQDLSNRFGQLKDRMVQNKSSDEQSRDKIARLGEQLRDTATGPMKNASGLLNSAATEPQSQNRKSQLVKASESQEKALEQLRSLTKSMSQWGHFQGLVAKTRDLLDRQENIRNQTMKVGKSMIGKPIESLTKQEQAQLKRVQRRQEQLADDIKQTLDHMQEMLATLSEKDPAGASSVEEALRSARAHHVNKRAQAAASAIENNRSAAASIEQQATAESIRKMASALQNRQDRELEEIRKKLEKAKQQIERLVQQQESLRTSTEQAIEKEDVKTVLANLSRDQRLLQRNTRFLGEELGESQQTAEVGQYVRQAATPMRSAMIKLRSGQGTNAMVMQDNAVELLNDSLALLETLKQQNEEEEFLRSLAQIRENLESIRTAQLEVNEAMDDLKKDVDRQGMVMREQARRSSKLARKQAGVREQSEALMSELDKVVVYRWALERVTKWMEQSQSSLYERVIDDALITTSHRIVSELDKLIEAIKQTQDMPVDSEFAEAESGGSGSGQSQKGKTKPVPTIAELLVLKAMQLDINERTQDMHDTFDADNATEQELQMIKMIGEDQAQVRNLTEKVTQRARSH